MTILWDWNGTLLADVQLAVSCEVKALEQYGFRGFTEEEYLQSFCFPVTDFYTLHGVDSAMYPKVAQLWSDEYRRRYAEAGLRPDTLQVLARLRTAGFRQLILSATEETFLILQVSHYPELPPLLDGICGIDNIYANGKADRALSLMQETGLAPDDVVLIGDTVHDTEVAHAVGCRCLLVEGGHQATEVIQTTGCPVYPSLTAVADALLTQNRGDLP